MGSEAHRRADLRRMRDEIVALGGHAYEGFGTR